MLPLPSNLLLMKTKILFLTAWYPNRYDPMPGLFVKRHAESVSEAFEVSVIHCLGTVDIKCKYEVQTFTENNVNTVIIYYRNRAGNIPLLSQLLKIIRFYKAYLKGWLILKAKVGVPGLVHANILTRVGMFALYLKWRHSIPYVITEHWSRYLPERNEYKGLLRKLLTKPIVANSSAISTVSVRLRDAMMDCGIVHPNFKIVNNVVDCNVFKPESEDIERIATSLNIAASKFPQKIFAHVSCFDDESKNISGLIRAIKELSMLRNDFLCLMVGDGPYKISAEQLARNLAIPSQCIQFTGLLEKEKLVSVYNISLFTVLFSNYENMPVVISESFACGKPVIATNVGGISEFVNKDTGILVQPKNEQELVNSLDFMLNHCREFNPSYIRGYAVANFSKEAVCTQLSAFYKLAIT